ncbi:hypothetical protein HPB47_004510 [Ixodes persulcatus]|uniref:Uncharacterized protein n=1 Tax=Ixodes persulcatus TaxID=34615 RepID=A0AC60PFL2_IXOPE|nr:hypothetical protein HPB47_004510 [Ixodes persulcatus]
MEHLVKDVLAPYAVGCIVEKRRPAGRNLPFALSTDASNKENRKLFPIAVRFYDVNGAEITDALIDFCEQADETSGGICELLATSLEKILRTVSRLGARRGVQPPETATRFQGGRQRRPGSSGFAYTAASAASCSSPLSRMHGRL